MPRLPTGKKSIPPHVQNAFSIPTRQPNLSICLELGGGVNFQVGGIDQEASRTLCDLKQYKHTNKTFGNYYDRVLIRDLFHEKE